MSRTVLAVLGLLAGWQASADEPALVQTVKDAIVSNRDALSHGTMRVRVKLEQPSTKWDVALDEIVHWDGPNILFVYTLKDLGGAYTTLNRGADNAGGVRKACSMLTKDAWFRYNIEANKILIRDRSQFPRERWDRLTQLLDVTPAGCWYRCFPPQGAIGWLEHIGPTARGMRPGSSYSITNVDGDHVVQTRRDPDGGVSEATFSLRQGGNPVSTRYTGTNRRASSEVVTYTWKPVPPGKTFVLQSCEFRSSVPGSPERELSRYRLDVDFIDLTSPSPSTFTLKNMAAFVPKDCMVQDGIRLETYPAHRGEVSTSEVLDDLATGLRSRGFLKPRG
jgi:hypothetical protein